VRRALAIAAAALLASLLIAPLADAANRRIGISNYTWTDTEIELDRGEHVTWYWIGPDMMHSVTGKSDNAEGIDSDPLINQPQHDLGDSFQASFDEPGTYVLACKLHSTVRGTVTVSSNPGDPVSEPDPVPQSRVDRTPPQMREVALRNRKFGRRGTSLNFSLGERSRVSAEFYRYDADGHRHFAGYRTYNGYIGFNGVRLGGRSKHFRPRPGSYLALIVATDTANNSAKPHRLRFDIRKRHSG